MSATAIGTLIAFLSLSFTGCGKKEETTANNDATPPMAKAAKMRQQQKSATSP